MAAHATCRLGPGARVRIVTAVKGGLSQKRAAAGFCVSPRRIRRGVVHTARPISGSPAP